MTPTIHETERRRRCTLKSLGHRYILRQLFAAVIDRSPQVFIVSLCLFDTTESFFDIVSTVAADVCPIRPDSIPRIVFAVHRHLCNVNIP